MIITCPSCQARYTVDPESVGNEGRRVKCTKCGHLWKFTPSSEDAEPVYRTPGLPDIRRSAQDALPDTRRGRRRAYGWLVSCVLIAAFTFAVARWQDDIVEAVPATEKIYEFLAPAADELREFIGIDSPERQPTAGLSLSNVKHRYIGAGSEGSASPVIAVTGDLTNVAEGPVDLPDVTILLYDEVGRLVGLWQFPPSVKTLGPGDAIQFWTRVVPPKDFATIRAAIGVARIMHEHIPTQ